ncbi:hypothetical protein [Labrys miyagiensis]|uniref:hypothetical protein n=1 Tax=Labrys miyagiensis TaxID=346912 RepID=UPI0024E17B0B|nr:hypothetical protein [Labrys miyagiensis]
MENLAHGASFHSLEKIAPPKPGIKNLVHLLNLDGVLSILPRPVALIAEDEFLLRSVIVEGLMERPWRS